MIAKLSRLYERLLFWKWDRESDAAVCRMRGCQHTRTIWVDVGTACEKCRGCWAIRVPDPFGTLGWVPNCANPKRARHASAPKGAV